MINDVPQKYMGSSCIAIYQKGTQVIIPLQYKRGLTILPHRTPTEEEFLELPHYDLTSETRPWNSKEAKPDKELDLNLAIKRIESRKGSSHTVNNRRVKFIHPKSTCKIDWSDKQLDRWRERLGYVPERVAKETLKANTQLVIV